MIEKLTDSFLLVTKNKSDFGTHNSLAFDLSHDLENIGRANSGKVCDGLDSLLKEYVEPVLEQLADIFTVRCYVRWLTRNGGKRLRVL